MKTKLNPFAPTRNSLAKRMDKEGQELSDLLDKIDKGKLDLCNTIADTTGNESFRNNPNALGMVVDEFEKEMRRISKIAETKRIFKMVGLGITFWVIAIILIYVLANITQNSFNLMS